MCGGPVPDRTGKPGRRASWCSKACRQAAWRARTVADRAARAAAELADRIAGTGYSDVQAAARALGEAVIAMCENDGDVADGGDGSDTAAIEDALMSGHRWERDVADVARRLAAAATRVAELADAHATHAADYHRARAVVRRPPAPRPGGDDSPAAPPAGIVTTTAAKALATNHPAAPLVVDTDDLFDAVEDVLADVRDAPSLPQDVLQEVADVPAGLVGPSFADALDALAAVHQAATGDGPVDDLAAAAAVVRAGRRTCPPAPTAP